MLTTTESLIRAAMRAQIREDRAAAAVPLEMRLPDSRFQRDARPIAVDDEDQTLDFALSTEHLDGHGTIIRAAGWDVSNYNGTFLLHHNATGDPVGDVIKTWRGEVEGVPALMGRVRFPADDMLASETYRKFCNRLYKSVSCRFLPIEVDPVRDSKERKRLGLPDWGFILVRQHLVEVSVVNTPSNPKTKLLELLPGMVGRGLLARGELAEARALILAGDDAGEDPKTAPLTREDGDRILAAIQQLGTSIEQSSRAGSPGAAVPQPEPPPQPSKRDLYQELLGELDRYRSAHGAQRPSVPRRAESPSPATA